MYSSLFNRRTAGLRLARRRLARRLLGVPDPVEEAVGRHLGDPFPAVAAVHQMFVDRLGRTSSSLPRPIRAQGLVGRVRDGTASIGRSPGRVA